MKAHENHVLISEKQIWGWGWVWNASPFYWWAEEEERVDGRIKRNEGGRSWQGSVDWVRPSRARERRGRRENERRCAGPRKSARLGHCHAGRGLISKPFEIQTLIHPLLVVMQMSFDSPCTIFFKAIYLFL